MGQAKSLDAKERKRAYNRAYKEANKERIAAYQKSYREKNAERLKAQKRAHYGAKQKQAKRAYYLKNRQRVLAQKQEYYVDKIDEIAAYRQANRERISEQNSHWHKTNRERLRSRKREESRQRRKDPHERIAQNLRRRINKAVRGKRTGSLVELIGCEVPELLTHLEAAFAEGMSWENYGRAWHIDHIRPCCSFVLTEPEQQRACFHFSNLQPLWAKENLRKGAKWT